MIAFFRLLWMISLCFPALAAGSAPLETLNIGVEATFSIEQENQRWQPIIRELQERLPDIAITLRVLLPDDLDKAVENRKVDVIICNFLDYLKTKHQIGLSTPLASLVLMDHGNPINGLGGTILIRSERKDITQLRDLKGKRIAAVDTRSLAGFQAQAYELHKADIDLPQDVTLFITGPPQNDLLDTLLEGRVDAIFVQTGQLETWQHEGRISSETLTVLNAKQLTGYPYSVSTTLYPEWPVAAMPQMDERTAKRLTAAMLLLPENHDANQTLGVYGFTLPYDYEPVRELAHHLLLPPFDQRPPVHFLDIWENYRWTIVSLFICMVIVVLLLIRTFVYASHLNKARLETIRNVERLDQERIRLHTLLKTLPDIVWLKDPQGVYLFCNPSFEPLCATTEEHIIGKTDYDFFDKQLSDYYREKDRLAIQAGIPTAYEEWMTTKDGSYTGLYLTTKTPMWDAEGKMIGVLGVARDITEKTRAEKELENYRKHLENLVADRTEKLNESSTQLKISQERYELALNATNDGLWDWNIQTNISYCSPTYFRMLGYEPGELGEDIQDHFIDLIHPEDQDNLISTVRHLLETKGGYEIEFRMQTKEGGFKWILSRGKVVEWDNDGYPCRAIGTHTDLTARKEMELELIRAKEQAESAMRAKSEFIANMSHEIRTPMNAIIGFSHLIKSDPLTPRQLDQLSKMSHAAQHLLQIINAILDFSKIEARKISLEIRDFEPARVIDKVCSIVSEKVTDKNLDLLVDMDHVHLMLRGDDLRLGQILINLVSNAVKFTEKGFVSINVSIIDERSDHIFLRFEVKDTGIGMTPEQVDHLFQPFEQADTSTTRRFGGTGLGLAISKRLVELMNGHIGLESEINKGTVFWMEIPFQKSTETAKSIDIASIQGTRVLVIDDFEDAREILSSMFIELGMRADTAASGEAGLTAVVQADKSGDPYQLLIIDWNMPGLNGVDTARLLQSISLTVRPIHLMITAYPDQALREEALSAGFTRILTKPVTPSILVDTLMETMIKLQPIGPPQKNDDRIGQELEKRRGAHILLVEDNMINQEVATQMLETVGMQVSTAENGKIALEMSRRTNYDLILMDVQMPIMDGLQATEQIRNMLNRKTVPILAMTANAFDTDRDDCLNAGMNDHVAKPVEPDKLYQSLVKWLPEREVLHPESADVSPSSGKTAMISDSGDDLAALKAIDGLDVDAALNRMTGNIALYIRLLNQFLKLHRHDADKLAHHLTAGDFDAIGHVTHSLKGLAGTLGAVRLEQAALESEKSVRQHKSATEIELQLKPTITALTDLLKALDTIFAQKNEPPETMLVDRSQAPSVMEQLEYYLSGNDASANNYFDQFKTLLTACLGSAAEIIGRQIDDFDYADALTTLRAAREKGFVEADHPRLSDAAPKE